MDSTTIPMAKPINLCKCFITIVFCFFTSLGKHFPKNMCFGLRKRLTGQSVSHTQGPIQCRLWDNCYSVTIKNPAFSNFIWHSRFSEDGLINFQAWYFTNEVRKAQFHCVALNWIYQDHYGEELLACYNHADNTKLTFLWTSQLFILMW